MRTTLTAAFVCLLAGCSGRPADGPPPPQTEAPRATRAAERPAQTNPAPKVWTREEFKALVLGKTEAEVIAAVGKPIRTGERGSSVYWEYRERTKDPVTGQVDWGTQVVFEGGVVDRIIF